MTRLSRHAERRCRQRGITPEMLALVFYNADREVYCGGGCMAIEIGREQVESLRMRHGKIIDHAEGIVIILNTDGEVVTVLRAYNRKAARRYRTGCH